MSTSSVHVLNLCYANLELWRRVQVVWSSGIIWEDISFLQMPKNGRGHLDHHSDHCDLWEILDRRRKFGIIEKPRWSISRYCMFNRASSKSGFTCNPRADRHRYRLRPNIIRRYKWQYFISTRTWTHDHSDWPTLAAPSGSLIQVPQNTRGINVSLSPCALSSSMESGCTSEALPKSILRIARGAPRTNKTIVRSANNKITA